MKTKTMLTASLTTAFFATAVFAITPVVCPGASVIKDAQFRYVFPNMKIAVFSLGAQSGYKGVVTVFNVTTEVQAKAYLKKTSAPYSIFPKSFFKGDYCMYRPGHDAAFPIPAIKYKMISWQTIM